MILVGALLDFRRGKIRRDVMIDERALAEQMLRPVSGETPVRRKSTGRTLRALFAALFGYVIAFSVVEPFVDDASLKQYLRIFSPAATIARWFAPIIARHSNDLIAHGYLRRALVVEHIYAIDYIICFTFVTVSWGAHDRFEGSAAISFLGIPHVDICDCRSCALGRADGAQLRYEYRLATCSIHRLQTSVFKYLSVLVHGWIVWRDASDHRSACPAEYCSRALFFVGSRRGERVKNSNSRRIAERKGGGLQWPIQMRLSRRRKSQGFWA
jgi:hypothetical protein